MYNYYGINNNVSQLLSEVLKHQLFNLFCLDNYVCTTHQPKNAYIITTFSAFSLLFNAIGNQVPRGGGAKIMTIYYTNNVTCEDFSGIILTE